MGNNYPTTVAAETMIEFIRHMGAEEGFKAIVKSPYLRALLRDEDVIGSLRNGHLSFYYFSQLTNYMFFGNVAMWQLWTWLGIDTSKFSDGRKKISKGKFPPKCCVYNNNKQLKVAFATDDYDAYVWYDVTYDSEGVHLHIADVPVKSDDVRIYTLSDEHVEAMSTGIPCDYIKALAIVNPEALSKYIINLKYPTNSFVLKDEDTSYPYMERGSSAFKDKALKLQAHVIYACPSLLETNPEAFMWDELVKMSWHWPYSSLKEFMLMGVSSMVASKAKRNNSKR